MREPMTTHAKREADRVQASATRVSLGGWAETLGKPLTHAIRLALDVALSRDVYWIEQCRDSDGERLLAELRPRLGELTPVDWAVLRTAKPHVWRVLAAAYPFRRVGHVPRETLPEAHAHALAAAFCRESHPVCVS